MARLSGKIFLAYLTVVFLALFAGDYLLIRFVEDLLLSNARQGLQNEWNEVSPRLAGWKAGKGPQPGLQEKLQRWAQATPYRLSLFELDGGFVADSLGVELRGPEVSRAVASGQAMAWRDTGKNSGQMLFFAKPTEDFVLRVGVATRHLQSLLDRLRAILWLGTGGLVLLSLAFYLAMSRRERLVLDNFQRMLRSLGKLDFAPRILVSKEDEVGRLGLALNTLAAEWEQRFRELGEERDRLRAILDTMQEGVIVLNAEGNILLFNPALRRLFNLDQGALGKSPIEVIRNADLQSVVERSMSGQEIEDCELRVLQEGQERHLLVQATPFAGPAQPFGAILVMYDITKLRRLERVRRDFVANVSHELKTPLTSIQGYVETLLDGAIREPDQAKTFLSIIDSNARRLNKLVEDLLRLSEIESQQFILRPERFKVAEHFGEILDLHDALLKKNHMTVEVRIEPEDAVVFCDRMALSHILNNLVDNAIKYGRPGTPVELHCERRGKDALFWVRDRGIGIPAHQLERIFERFYRIDKSRSRQEGSTGLGLAIVKHLVQLLGGEIRVESREEEGSTFSFRVPGAFPAAADA
ncbi:MAG: ATP-binding protein [bacterium]